jgi:homoserine kinase
MRLRAYAPASIGNFAAGFDLMGAALAPLDGSLWGDVVEAEAAAVPSLTVSGSHASFLATVPPWENLVLRTYALYREALREKGIECPGVAFHLEKGLPRSSGLGSSAASVAATLAACQGLLGDPLSRNELYTVAGKAEALVSGAVHLDNVVPALAGGVQLLVPGPGGTTEARPLPWFDDLVLVVASPTFELSTESSRKALPKSFTLAETVGFAQNLASFVHALESGDRGLLRRCLRDPLAEPHRASLVPGFRAAQAAAMADGALGCTFSGSGPSMFAITQSKMHGREVAEIIKSALADAGLTSEVRLCGVDHQGARVLS